MALGVYFTPNSFTANGYDEVTSLLEAAGAGSPAGRLYHVALERHADREGKVGEVTIVRVVSLVEVDPPALSVVIPARIFQREDRVDEDPGHEDGNQRKTRLQVPPGPADPPGAHQDNPTAIRLAIAAPSSTTPARSALGSSLLAWLAVVSGVSLHTVAHTHAQNTSARMSHPISGTSGPAPINAAATPTTIAAPSDTSSFVRANDPRGTGGRSADPGCMTSGWQSDDPDVSPMPELSGR